MAKAKSHSGLEVSDVSANKDHGLQCWLEEEDDEKHRVLIHKGKPASVLVFYRWIMVFVAPFEAVWTLERHCSKFLLWRILLSARLNFLDLGIILLILLIIESG